MNSATIRSRSSWAYDRLDAHFFTSPGVAAAEKVAILEARGLQVATLGDIATSVWSPARFARSYASSAEQGIPYLRPYDVFEYRPVARDRLSLARNADVSLLVPNEGTLLQTCSGRNLGPLTIADSVLAEHALSHDMVRIEIEDHSYRYYVLAFLKTAMGQALLRRGRSGSVIDHITANDVASVPIPLVSNESMDRTVQSIKWAMDQAAEARRTLLRVQAGLAENHPFPARATSLADGWSVNASGVAGRLDAAFHDPLVRAVQAELRRDGLQCGDIANVDLPVRYKRYYVDANFGRPVLSGRQILQFEPINLRFVSDRSFKGGDYTVTAGTTAIAADGRAQGAQGSASLISEDRNGWLASDHVMRLRPREGVLPGAVWLSISTRQARLQFNATSFGSVIDETRPEDVRRIYVPAVPDQLALQAEEAWTAFAQAAKVSQVTIEQLNNELWGS